MKKRKKKKFNSLKSTQGAMRKAHFENGGTTTTWRGRAATFPDKKKVNDRNKCRGKKDESYDNS